jgi:hypothetical protein
MNPKKKNVFNQTCMKDQTTLPAIIIKNMIHYN